MQYELTNNEQLLLLLTRGDESAFAELFRLFKRRLLLEAMELLGDSQDAEDAVQEIFMRIWINRSSLPAVSNIEAYLVKIIRNRCHDIRDSKDVDSKRKQNYFLHKDSVSQPVIKSELKELEISLADAIQALPPRMQESFLRYHVEEKPHRVIATEMGIAVITVRQHVSRAAQQLREKLKIKFS